MRTTEEWLRDKLFEYGKGPQETIGGMLATTNEVITQYLNNQTFKTAKELDICIKHNRLFLSEVGIISIDE